MPTSLPSREIYVIDIPDVNHVDSQFVYNYFVSGEAVDELAGISSRYLSTSSDLVNANDAQRLATRIPRWIQLKFKTVRINDPMSNVTLGTSNVKQQLDTSLSRRSKGNRRLIADNLTKIMTEEEFSSYYFTAMDFRDSAIYDKLHTFVSGTLVYTALLEPSFKVIQNRANYASTMMGMAQQALNMMPAAIDSRYVAQVVNNPEQFGRNFETTAQKNREQKLESDISRVTPTAQVNVKFAASMVERAILDPLCQFDSDLMKTYESAQQTQNTARQHLKSSVISANEYKTKAPPVKMFGNSAAGASSKQRVEIIGYLIDKIEVKQDGSIIAHDPLIVENPHVGFAIDFSIKYYSTYTYIVRTLALVTMPAIMEDLNDIANAQFIIASRPAVTTVNCIENVPPPPVADLNFVWDYDAENLTIVWSFPPNPQRDVKKFQIYRRSSVDEPFSLLKMYDFDDSELKAAPGDNVEYVANDYIESMVGTPRTFYVDKDFNKNSKYIYSVTCVDAHGIASGYSAQFELSFDVFKNRLVKKLVSHMGAPRTYPNMYLESDAFVDTICDGPAQAVNPSGPHSRLRVYFTPECYNIQKNGIKKPVVVTSQDGGKYKLLMIDVDNQQQQVVDMYIDNMLGEKT